MRIAFIVHQFPKLSETFILNQITGLLDLGHHVDIYAKETPNQITIHSDVEKYHLMDRTFYFVPDNKLIRILKTPWLLIKSIGKSPLKLLATLNVFKHGKSALSLKLLYLFVAIRELDYDILQCHFGRNGKLGAQLKQLGIRGKIVTTFHGTDTRLGLKKGKNFYRKLFQSGDCFIALSKYNYCSLVSLGLDEKKIITHSCGIAIDKFPFRWHSSTVNDIRPVKVLTVARLIPEKGLPFAIRAISQVLNTYDISLEYQIIGGGPLRHKLEKMVQEMDLAAKIRILGPQSYSSVVTKLLESHIFLLPSVAESFGVVLLEAQAVGLPVIATSVGGTNQAIVNGKTGFLVKARSVDAISEKLMFLIKRPNLWLEMGQAGREYVKEKYDIRVLNKRLEDIYMNILDQR